MHREIFVLALIVCFAAGVSGQNQPVDWPQRFFKGYARSLSGETISYHSPQPEVGSALLVRSLDSKRFIEWETEAVPEDYQGDFVTFLWMFGIDVNVDSHTFELFVNGAKWFTFSNPKITEKKTWRIAGNYGAELIFRTTMIDRYDDLMGYASLRLPRSALVLGRPQRLKVVGESAGSYAWYMTFETGVEEKVTIHQQEALLRENGKRVHSILFDFVHLKNKMTGSITIEPDLKTTFELEPGFNSIRVKIPEVTKPTEFSATIQIGDQAAFEKKFTVKPVRPWTIYFVQHTHTDIGYTRPQTEILPEHLRFIDYALDYCDQTDHYPDDAKFRWTCESSWAVREFLTSRPPEQIKRLKKRIDEGRIEVTAMFFNMSELLDETALAAQLQPLRLFKERGITVKTAMQDDVNGIGWCLADYFKDVGIEHLIMGEHGHRALIPFDRPTAFWWESPSGKRVLAYRAEHYMYGNFMDLPSPKFEFFERALLDYLEKLGKTDYPFDRTALQYSGYFTDNSPPSLAACETIRRWNEMYEWPRLRNATASEFMAFVKKNHADTLPVYRVAWPDWWTDGVGSAARETAFARLSHADLIANQGLLAIVALLGSPVPERAMETIAAINDALLFYDEHTFGAAESITDPMAENSMVQWSEKAAYVWEAAKRNRLLREAALGLVQPYLNRAEVPTLVVFNTLNWKRSGLSVVYIDHEILPTDRMFRIVAEDGEEVPAQALKSRYDGTYWAIWTKDIPPMGYKIYRIKVGTESRVPPAEVVFEDTLENAFYRLVIDPEKGALRSLYDKELKCELVDPEASWALGQFIYERLGYRRQLELFKLEEFQRSCLQGIKLGKVIDGPIWKSLEITGFSPECADQKGVTCEIRLYKPEKRIELNFSMCKLPVTEPEAVYVAFPFYLPGGQIVFEAQGGMVTPGKDQLEGTASDWNTIQNFAAVRNDRAQVIFVSPECPLVQFGGINLGKFQRVANPEKPYIFSWVLNNYWPTNFKASQEGELNWSYGITSSPDPSNSFATRFGWGSRIPFLVRVLPAGKGKPQLLSQSLLDLNVENILLITARPSKDGKGILLHLREVNGEMAKIDLRFKSITEVNVLEEPLRKLHSPVIFNPYEVKFLKLELKIKKRSFSNPETK
ncbi:MAG: hypothetical protein ONB05_05485 [candidate division KSB1 bacterium]|nr:hypothetical protein [candidate division KSB1 bacterium]